MALTFLEQREQPLGNTFVNHLDSRQAYIFQRLKLDFPDLVVLHCERPDQMPTLAKRFWPSLLRRRHSIGGFMPYAWSTAPQDARILSGPALCEDAVAAGTAASRASTSPDHAAAGATLQSALRGRTASPSRKNTMSERSVGPSRKHTLSEHSLCPSLNNTLSEMSTVPSLSNTLSDQSNGPSLDSTLSEQGTASTLNSTLSDHSSGPSANTLSDKSAGFGDVTHLHQPHPVLAGPPGNPPEGSAPVYRIEIAKALDTSRIEIAKALDMPASSGAARAEKIQATSTDRDTTVMIRNLPTTLLQRHLLAEIDRSGFRDKYDFCYFPTLFNEAESKGYAFVNFVDTQTRTRFVEKWHHRHLPGMPPTLAGLNVSMAAVQGLSANLRKFARNRMRRIRNPDLVPFVPQWAQENV